MTDITPMSEEGALRAARELSDEEIDDLVRAHLTDAIMVGAALTERKERGTWKASHTTWETFCQETYGITRVTAWRKIQQHRANRELPQGTQPSSQRKVLDARSTEKKAAETPAPPPPAPEEPPVAPPPASVPVHDPLASLQDDLDEIAAEDEQADVMAALREENALLRDKVKELQGRVQSLLRDLNARPAPDTTAQPIRTSEAARLADAVLFMPVLLDLDPDSVAFTIEDTELRWSTAKRLRRWVDRFEMAAKGFTAPPERSETVTPRFKERDKPKG
ncbi:MAG TPA: hypothetical protein VMU09_11210 [Acidimicrobiales bacterium]|nr:hypothetical protein [Acidimicrobiales bacterium]